MPGSKEYRDVHIEVVELAKVLEANGLESREQLIDLCILMGTDYNPGVRGIGPKKGLKLIKEQGTLKKALLAVDQSIPDMEMIREIFIRVEHLDDYRLDWLAPKRDKIVEFMCGEHEFSEARINAALDRLDKKEPVRRTETMPISQSSLDQWG